MKYRIKILRFIYPKYRFLYFFMWIKINNLFESRFTFFAFVIIKNIINCINDILLNLYLLFIRITY